MPCRIAGSSAKLSGAATPVMRGRSPRILQRGDWTSPIRIHPAVASRGRLCGESIPRAFKLRVNVPIGVGVGSVDSKPPRFIRRGNEVDHDGTRVSLVSFSVVLESRCTV